MTEREALKLALEALEDAGKDDFWRYQDKAITAIKEALAQPEQEPVAVKTLSKIGKAVGYWRADLVPPHIGPGSHDITPLYTTPPQRKPLSDEEIILIVAECASSHQHTDIHLARAIEAAHGIKEKA